MGEHTPHTTQGWSDDGASGRTVQFSCSRERAARGAAARKSGSTERENAGRKMICGEAGSEGTAGLTTISCYSQRVGPPWKDTQALQNHISKSWAVDPYTVNHSLLGHEKLCFNMCCSVQITSESSQLFFFCLLFKPSKMHTKISQPSKKLKLQSSRKTFNYFKVTNTFSAAGGDECSLTDTCGFNKDITWVLQAMMQPQCTELS